MSTTTAPRIELVVCDLAGTTVDYGSTTPILGFAKVFGRHGLSVSRDELTGPMGKKKDDHIREVLAIPHVAAQWKTIKGADHTEADVQAMLKEFIGVDLEIIPKTSSPITGVPAALKALKARGVKVAFTTGYPRVLADLCLTNLRAAGVPNDSDVSADEVPAGRPAPHMLLKTILNTKASSVTGSLAIGDTEADIRAAKNAGFIAVGVSKSGMLVGLNETDLKALPAAEIATKVKVATDKLFSFGADHVIDDASLLPALIADIESGKIPARRA